jgi:2-haloacid dehalogenase
MQSRTLVFDAYGTLFDVHSLVMSAGSNLPGDVSALSVLWRQKQLEYTWLRSLMDRYQDFWEITEAALRSSVAQLNIEATAEQLDCFMRAYLKPPAFPDAIPALQLLERQRMAILSNGSPGMLESAIRHNALEPYFAAVISVDQVKTYKPSPRVYALGSEILGAPAEEILFVSSNSWDVAGAKAFGYQVCWCNRSAAQMDPPGFDPDITIPSLEHLGHALSADKTS